MAVESGQIYMAAFGQKFNHLSDVFGIVYKNAELESGFAVMMYS